MAVFGAIDAYVPTCTVVLVATNLTPTDNLHKITDRMKPEKRTLCNWASFVSNTLLILLIYVGASDAENNRFREIETIQDTVLRLYGIERWRHPCGADSANGDPLPVGLGESCSLW